MAQTAQVPARFNGPLDSGNGGYSCGVFAALVEGPVAVSLRSPIPLDTELRSEPAEGGGLDLLDGDTLIAQVRPADPLELEVPEPVSAEEARAAVERYRGTTDGPFSRCFICGRSREDSHEVFAGAVEGRDVVASPWTPPESTGDDAGVVRPEFVWAVLDCPTYFALYPDSYPMSFLGRMQAEPDGEVRVGEEHVVMAWEIGKDGRKHRAGAAVLDPAGRVVARSDALLIDTTS